MSLLKPLLVGCFLLTLQACGFQPLYREDPTGQSAGNEFNSILVLPISDRVGQELRNHLYDALSPKGRPTNPRWKLDITLTESIEKISVEQTSFSTRANLKLTGSYILSPVGEGEQEEGYGGSVSAISSYNILDSEYATLVAERDARSRAVKGLSNNIRHQIAIWLNRRAL